jgi:hypothetical protein
MRASGSGVLNCSSAWACINASTVRLSACLPCKACSPDWTAAQSIAARFGLVRLVQLRQVLGDVFLQLFLLALERLEVEVLARRGERLELAAVDDHQPAADQAHLPAERDERPAGQLEGSTVVLAKVGEGLEVWRQATEQPTSPRRCAGIRAPTAARSGCVETAVQVQLADRQDRRRPSCRLRLRLGKAQCGQTSRCT